MKPEIDRLKMCLKLELINTSGIQLSLVYVDKLVHEFPNSVFYICKDGFTFEKSNNIKYTIHRLTIPSHINKQNQNNNIIYNFACDSTRYIFLKQLKKNLSEFARNGFFGKNINSHIVTYDTHWFVY